MTGSKGEDAIILKRVPCIRSLMQLQKKGKEVLRALINSGSKLITMTSAYTKKLGLRIYQTNVGVSKIDGSSLKTFEIATASFWVLDKLSRVQFF